MTSIGPTRPSTKQQESAEIERLTREYLRKRGKIEQVCSHESKWRPTWKAYSDLAFEGRNDD